MLRLKLTFAFLLIGCFVFGQKTLEVYQNGVTSVAKEFHDIPPIRDMKPIPLPIRVGDINKKRDKKTNHDNQANALPKGDDPIWQKVNGSRAMRAPIQNWEGLGSGPSTTFSPPDPSGAAGPNHYVQMFNGGWQVFDKTGNPLSSPQALSLLFPGSSNDGDPIVMYDETADRWFVSQFQTGNFDVLIAISKTPDPLGGWYQYNFGFSALPDYLKFSVWSDGYYMTSNSANNAVVFERNKMLVGDPTARQQQFSIPSMATNGFNSSLPSDYDGVIPPVGAPCVFAYYQDDSWAGVAQDALKLWEFSTDWVTTANSTISLVNTLPLAAFNSNLGPGFNSFTQPGTAQKLDGIEGALMYRLQYRNMGGYQAIVGDFTVDVDGTQHGGIRWFELRNTGTGWSLYQEGTFAPDSQSRFMGSISMDSQGNIGMGYSVVGSTTKASLRYTGRMAGDPLGQMTVAEQTIFNGGGVSTTVNRFGDYAQLTMDPTDNLTFWYTGEYFRSNNNWTTRIASFKLGTTISLDASLSGISAPSGQICGSSNITPTVTLTNMGTTTLTSATINYNLDGGTNNTFLWTGSLATGQSATINLPAMTPTAGAHIFNANVTSPNGGTDLNTSNNASSSNFNFVTNGQTITISVSTDCWGTETTWTLKDAGGITIASGGPYTDGTTLQTYTTNVCVGDGCYDFTINDSFGDGMAGNGVSTCTIDGNYVITKANGTVLVQMPVANFGSTVTHNFCVTSTPPCVVSLGGTTNVSCNGGSNGTASVTVSGGATPFVYNWSNGGTSISETALTSGVQAVTVTDQATCNQIVTVTIAAPTPITASINGTTISCNGNSDGSVALTVNGGTTAYSFNWSNATTTQNLLNVIAGNYTVTIMDANNCNSTSSIVLTEPNVLSVTLSKTDETCGSTNGSITSIVTGGTTPYTYVWNNSITSANLVNISAATYSVTVTDNNGCTAIASSTILNIAGPTISGATSNDATCGVSNGNATVTTTGGTAPIAYTWSSGGNTAVENNLTAGSYTVTISDANSCNVTQFFIINNLGAPTVSVSTTIATCGSNNGSATAAPSGGATPYNYIWSSGGTTITETGLAANSYTITVTDNNSCSAVQNFVINNSSPSVTTTAVNNSICGSANGSATVAASGGTTPYTYNWDNGQSVASGTNLLAGTHNVTVSDNASCTVIQTITITNAAGAAVSITTNNSTCGNSNGIALANVTGGTTPLVYGWSTGGTSSTETGITAGTFSLTVSDNNACTTISSFTITNTSGQTTTATSTNAICTASNGTATVTTIGGTSPFTYLWNDGANQTTAVANSLTSGTYKVTVTDANLCSSVSNVTVSTTTTVITLSSSSTNVSCNGGNDGTATTSATGGTTPYNYVWSNGQNVQNAINLSAANYTVTVTDANGCNSNSSTTVSQPATLFTNIAGTNTTCNGTSDGIANLSVIGGTTPYSFNWANGATTEDLMAIGAGSYQVTVTDAKGCINNSSVVITQPAAISLTTTINNNASCGSNNGAATVTVNSGGTSPFNYIWSSGGNAANESNLAVGTYTVTVNDLNTCSATASISITNVSGPVITLSSTNATCGAADGTATVTVGSGVSPFTYNWSSGSTIQTASSLVAANYLATVTDANGCTAVGSVFVNNSIPALSVTSTNDICTASMGTATATASAGATPYTYAWSFGGASSIETGLGAGTYSVTLTDNAGCTAFNNVTITDAAAATLSSTVTDETCGNGNGVIAILATGGATPFSYNWSSGGNSSSINNLSANNYSVTVTDANNCTSSINGITVANITGQTLSTTTTDASCGGITLGTATAIVSGGATPYNYNWATSSTSQTANLLPAGTYGVTVTDANGCVASATATVTNSPSPIITTTVTNATCSNANGTATGIPTGGTPPYTYNWTSGGTSSIENNLAQGSFTITVTDSKNCKGTAVAVINNIAGVTVITTITDATCGSTNGSATAISTGGSSPYNYLWSNGATTAVALNLGSGGYSITVTDANSCIASVNTFVSNSSFTFNISTTDAACGNNNGSALTSVTGGLTPYTYNWTSGATTPSDNNLSGGNYAVTITDANACVAVNNFTINANSAPTITSSFTNATCGNTNGTASITVTGGVSPISYAWPNGETTASINNTLAGNYIVTVTDANTCSNSQLIKIIDEAGPTITVATQDETCGNSNGIASLSTTGGLAPLTINWSTGGNSAIETGLTANTYGVTVTDANGCTVTNAPVINNISGATLTTTTSVATCSNSNGVATVTANGGISPLTYSWSSGGATASESGLAAGTYSVIVTDANNCVSTQNVTVTDASAPTVNITTTDATCGNNNGTATTVVSGGTAPFNYAWSNGGAIAAESNLAANTYIITVTDANTCQTTATGTINNLAGATVTINITDENCGKSNGTAGANVSGGTTPYTYAWSNGTSSTSVNNLAAGTISVTITDGSSCAASATTTINNAAGPTVSSTATSATCGNANGTATITATSGTTPYIYAWSSGGGSSTQNNLAAGNYGVTVVDANGCLGNTNFSISNITGPTAILSTTAASCGIANGSAAVTVNGGITPYTYAWSSGGNSNSLLGLAAGGYAVTVSDNNNCSFVQNFNINNILPVLSLTSTDASCGTPSGTATVTATGGLTPYVYTWTSGSNSPVANSLISGTYTVSVLDASGCISTEIAVIGTIAGPTVNITTTEALCGNSDGSAASMVSGGTLPYLYSWSNGSNAPNISNVNAGTYSVTVTDANNCGSVAVGFVNNTVPTSSLSINNETCSSVNGSAAIATTGSSSPFSYNWSNGGTGAFQLSLAAGNYTVTVTDVNTCLSVLPFTITDIPGPSVVSSSTEAACGTSNGAAAVIASGGSTPYTYTWSNGGVTFNQNNLASGQYVVTVTDNNNCMVIENIAVSNPAPSISLSTIDASCGNANGFASLLVSGGATPYTYQWASGGTSFAEGSLAAGSYQVTVSDVAGCVSFLTAIINDPGSPVLGVVTSDAIACLGITGSAVATANGGTTPYSFTWSTGATAAVESNLPVGNYTVAVEDAKMCGDVINLTINSVDSAIVTSIVINANCGNANGSIAIELTGGSTPFNYNWSNGETSDFGISNLTAGTYGVLISDANGCVSSQNYQVLDLLGAVANIIKTNAKCDGDNGIAEAAVQGGTEPYFYNWSNGSSDAEVNHLAVGSYTLTVTDDNNCVTVKSIDIVMSDAVCFNIPSGFTPNGDGVNDIWKLRGVELFPDVQVEIYNRWGSRLFQSLGYTIPWDGKYKGRDVPTDAYYYVITVNDNHTSKGTVTIKR